MTVSGRGRLVVRRSVRQMGQLCKMMELFFGVVRRKEGRVQLSLPRFAGMLPDDDDGGGHSHLDPFYDGSSEERP